MKTVAYSCAAVANISTLQVLHPYIRSKQINEISYRKVPAILPVARDSTRRAQGRAQDLRFGYSTFFKDEKKFDRLCALHSFQSRRVLASRCSQLSPAVLLGFATAG